MARAQGREYVPETRMYKSFVIKTNFAMDTLLAVLSLGDQ